MERSRPDRDKAPPSPLIPLLEAQAAGEGFHPTILPEVVLMRATCHIPPVPVAYNPSIVIVAQGRKLGRLGDKTFVYDANNYLVLSLPLPFECETIATPEKPMLAVSVGINPATVMELLLAQDLAPPATPFAPNAISSSPLTQDLADAALRLLRCLGQPSEARILGPQIIREITYRVLCGEHGETLRMLAAPQSHFAQIARALRRIHQDYAQPLDVTQLSREAGMSVSTFHANFKSVTATSPVQYLKSIRLHKAQMLLLRQEINVGTAAQAVGYESPSQFSREFKRHFGFPPAEVSSGSRLAYSMS